MGTTVHEIRVHAGARGRQERSQLTRLTLLRASILCLSRHGFGGTTMPKVAAIAGVSPGPRQYYFPTREDLFEAVVEHLIRVQRRWYELPASIEGPSAALHWLVQQLLRFSGSPPQIAMLEMRLAMKHQPDLAERIAPRIAELEAGNDRAWLALLAGSGRSELDILALRRLMSAISRGLVFEPETDRHVLGAMVDHMFRLIGIDASAGAIDDVLCGVPETSWDPVIMGAPDRGAAGGE